MFKTMMNKLLQVITYIIVYINNILIFTKPGQEEEHDQIVKKMLEILWKNDLYLKPKKCFFAKKKIEFLRVWVSENGVQMDNEKVWAVQEWLHPSRVKQVQKFLGLANYYRCFIQGYSKIACLLYKLIKKNQPLKWEARHQMAFENLKLVLLKHHS